VRRLEEWLHRPRTETATPTPKGELESLLANYAETADSTRPAGAAS
jgi:hypothetical protein